MYHILTSKGPRPTNLEMGSHFNVIMMAGAVTTATFLAGVTYYLGHNKAALSRLQREVRTRFNSLEEINSKALMECEYLNAVCEEGLRIYPPAGAGHLSRIVPKGGCEIEGEWIPEGVSYSYTNLRNLNMKLMGSVDSGISPPMVCSPRSSQLLEPKCIHPRTMDEE